MPSATIPLDDLARRIGDQEAELKTLRMEYAAREAKLTELTRRKKQLQDQLAAVESTMQTLGHLAGPTPTSQAAGSISLPKFLVHLVQQAKRPMTTKELAQEVVRQKFPSTSKNLSAMVEARVSELLRKGVLRRSADRSGIIPAGMSAAAKPAMPVNGAKSNGVKSKSSKGSPATRMPEPGQKLSLKALLAQVLAKSSRPLSATELAQRVLATGYQTKSKDFKNVIWVGIGNIDNVELVPGKGYRLRKGKR
jgi:hypothetical protein